MQPMYAAKVNSPTTQLASNITATQTSIPVQDVNVLPAAPNLATIGRGVDAETILYAGIDTVNNTLTNVTRGFQGIAKAWNAGEQIGRFYTAYDHDTFIANIQAAVDVPNGAKIYGRVGQWEQIGVGGASVISEFTSPGPDPGGLTWDGSYLWCSDFTNNRIYQLTTTGTIVSQFTSPSGTPTGLTWDGTHLWNADYNANKMYQLTTTGTIVSQFNSPGTRLYGLTWDGVYLWNVSIGAGRIHRLTTTGTVVSQFSSPGTGPTGLAWDGTHLWHADRSVDGIYQLTTTGTIVRQFTSPWAEPAGLAWDGTHLWHADRTADKIGQLSVVEKFRLISIN